MFKLKNRCKDCRFLNVYDSIDYWEYPQSESGSRLFICEAEQVDIDADCMGIVNEVSNFDASDCLSYRKTMWTVSQKDAPDVRIEDEPCPCCGNPRCDGYCGTPNI